MIRRLYFSLFLFFALLFPIDRLFFKANDSFCLHFLTSTLPHKAEWECSEQQNIEYLISKKFSYLGKGTQCIAFLSEDGACVLKFYRFPSHLRKFPYLTHPFSYLFSERRKKIKAYNEEKLQRSFESFVIAAEEFKEETGLIYIHLNPTSSLPKRLTLIDKLGMNYTIDPNGYSFLIQKRAERIGPKLEKLISAKNRMGIQQLLEQIFVLVESGCQKGIQDGDPVLQKNWGLLEKRAIHIDVGAFKKTAPIHSQEEKRALFLLVTAPIREKLSQDFPEALEDYHDVYNSIPSHGRVE